MTVFGDEEIEKNGDCTDVDCHTRERVISDENFPIASMDLGCVVYRPTSRVSASVTNHIFSLK